MSSFHNSNINIVVYFCDSLFSEYVSGSFENTKLVFTDRIDFYAQQVNRSPSPDEYKYISQHLHYIIPIVERYQYYEMRSNEISFILDRLFVYFVDLITKEKIDQVIFSNTPHTLCSYLLLLAANYLKVDPFAFQMSSLNGFFRFRKLLFNPDDLSFWQNSDPIPSQQRQCNEVKEVRNALHKYLSDVEINNSKPQNFYRVLDNFKSGNLLIKKLVFSNRYLYIFSFILLGFLRGELVNRHRALSKVSNDLWMDPLSRKRPVKYAIHFLYNSFSYLNKQKLAINYYKRNSSNFKLPKKYIFFPLQMQPEATSTPLGWIFGNFTRALSYLRNNLPNDFSIVIKEHPYQHDLSFSMARLGRSVADYQSMLTEKVLFSPSDYPTNQLITNSAGVAVVTSSVGIEAIAYSKPVLVMGFPWWYIRSGSVFHVSSADDFLHFIEAVKNNKFSLSREDYIDALSYKLYSGEFAEMNSKAHLSNDVLSYLCQDK